jgi:hypothetical protein
MFRTIAIAAAFFSAVYLSGAQAFDLMPQSVAKHKHSHSLHLPKCKTEDSDNCIWNAHTSGNGEGNSFIAYHGYVYYLETDEMDRKMGW